MGGVHDLLSTEVPEVAAELLIRGVQLPGLNPDSIGHGLMGIELLTPEAAGEGGFAGCAFAYQDDLDLGYCAGAFFG